MGVGVRLGKGLAGCGGFLGLRRLVAWRGHIDGMAADGDRRVGRWVLLRG